MKIPKRFTLGGQTITVEYEEGLGVDKGLLGCIQFGTNQITLQPVMKGLITKTMAEEVFVHEMVHGIFNKCMPEEADTEQNVSAVATLLYQALTTMEYK